MYFKNAQNVELTQGVKPGQKFSSDMKTSAPVTALNGAAGIMVILFAIFLADRRSIINIIN